MDRRHRRLGRLLSGEVVVDRLDSHLHSPVESSLEEALAEILSLGRDHFVATHDFGTPIGLCTRVRTTPDDVITWAQRPGRGGRTRFVQNRRPEPSSLVTVVLRIARTGLYVCLSAWIGGAAEPEPWDEGAGEQSVTFWSEWALVWGTEPVVPGTETSDRLLAMERLDRRLGPR